MAGALHYRDDPSTSGGDDRGPTHLHAEQSRSRRKGEGSWAEYEVRNLVDPNHCQPP